MVRDCVCSCAFVRRQSVSACKNGRPNGNNNTINTDNKWENRDGRSNNAHTHTQMKKTSTMTTTHEWQRGRARAQSQIEERRPAAAQRGHLAVPFWTHRRVPVSVAATLACAMPAVVCMCSLPLLSLFERGEKNRSTCCKMVAVLHRKP